MKLDGRVALLLGAGQTPGETIGNGRAAALLYGGAGARVLCVDRDLAAAEATAELIAADGRSRRRVHGRRHQRGPDPRRNRACVATFGRIDILHCNVGVSLEGGDATVTDITVEAFDNLVAVNLRSMVLAAKWTLPVMRAQGSGVIITISSMAAWSAYPYVGYKATKAGVVAFTEQLALQNARYGIRANCILPGLMNTPMAVEKRARLLAGERGEHDGAGLAAARAEVVGPARRPGPVGRPDGHGLGRGQGGVVPGIRRCWVHYWSGAPGRRWRQRESGVGRVGAVKPLVGVVMGSVTDWDTMRLATETLERFEIAHEKRVVSAHRTPDLMARYAETARWSVGSR